MKWYVVNYDFNKGVAKEYDIFSNIKFLQGLQRINEEIDIVNDFETFKVELDSVLRYCFWSKCEYEIYVKDAFHNEPTEITKVDVYDQVKPNLEILANYIASNKDEIPSLI